MSIFQKVDLILIQTLPNAYNYLIGRNFFANIQDYIQDNNFALTKAAAKGLEHAQKDKSSRPLLFKVSSIQKFKVILKALNKH